MKYLFLSVIFLATARFCQGGPLRLQKRAAFYIANETACVVDSTVYSNGDPIPTDDPCEACKCRPPGFACVLKECIAKPGCRAVRRAGHCCPEYICGCEHNGRMYRDGDEIQDTQNPCYTCHCQGSSIACAFVDCFFRVDCAPEYVAGECCPRYTHCSSVETNTSGLDVTTFPVSTDSNVEVITISETFPTTESTQRYDDQTKDTSTETPQDEAIREKAPTAESENTDPIHFIPDTVKEEYASETQDRGSSSSQTSEQKGETTESAENADSTESQDDLVSETDNKSELLNIDSELNNEESVEESEKPEDSSESTTADSNDSVPADTTVSKGNVEIFADKATTATPDLSSSDPKTTEVPTTKLIEIETNTIEKRFRSLENGTFKDATAETTETKEQLENGELTSTEMPEVVISTEAPEKQFLSEEIKTSTQVQPTGSSVEVLESKFTTINHNDEPTNADKSTVSLYYNAEEKISVPVTTVVHVHEETSSSKNDEVKTSTFVTSSGDEQNLSTQTDNPKEIFGSVDKEFSEIPY